jgi:hypothetical protein
MSAASRTHSFTDRTGTRFILELADRWSPSESHALVSLQDSLDGALLQMTPFPPILAARVRNDLRASVQVAANQALIRSVEPSIEIKSFELGQASGYYFSAQDRKPKPGGWPFMTGGLFAAQGQIINFTILSHRVPPEGTKEAFAAIAGMQIVTAVR